MAACHCPGCHGNAPSPWNKFTMVFKVSGLNDPLAISSSSAFACGDLDLRALSTMFSKSCWCASRFAQSSISLPGSTPSRSATCSNANLFGAPLCQSATRLSSTSTENDFTASNTVFHSGLFPILLPISSHTAPSPAAILRTKFAASSGFSKV